MTLPCWAAFVTSNQKGDDWPKARQNSIHASMRDSNLFTLSSGGQIIVSALFCVQVSRFWDWWKTRVTGIWGTCGRTIDRGQLWAEDSTQVSLQLQMLAS